MSRTRVTRPSASVLMTMFENWSGSDSRPCTCTGSWKAAALVAKGGWPMAPAAAWTFWARRAPTMSEPVRPRSAALAGSIQMRIE